MPLYEVLVVCDSCGTPHPMGIRLRLEDGPPDRMSVGDAYAGHELPPQVATLLTSDVRCPETGRVFRPRDTDQVFLLPEQ
jgi:hypothetical protein